MFHRKHAGGRRMRGWTALACMLAAVLALPVLQGCAAANSAMGGNTSKQAQADVSWDHARDGVLIEIDAADDLNRYQDAPHTLLLTVFQTADAPAFGKLAADPVQLARALESGQAGAAFVQTTRYVVMPGRRTLLALERAAQARYIGLVAGYYQLDTAGAARLFEVPLTIDSKGWVSTTYSAAPAQLAIRLQLGAQAITDARRLNAYPVPKRETAWVPLDGGGREIELAPKAGDRSGGPAVKKL